MTSVLGRVGLKRARFLVRLLEILGEDGFDGAVRPHAGLPHLPDVFSVRQSAEIVVEHTGCVGEGLWAVSHVMVCTMAVQTFAFVGRERLCSVRRAGERTAQGREFVLYETG